MDCKFFVKVPPLIKTDSNNDSFGIFRDYHEWLRENNITRYRGGNWPGDTLVYKGENLTFQFADKEDAMAFKLAWV